MEHKQLLLEAKVAQLLDNHIIAIPSLSWDPDSSDARERDAIRRIGTIFGAYQVHTWFWELSEMLRKFLMVGLLIFVSPGEPAQLGVALLITLFFLCAHLILQPFSTTDLNNMQTVSQTSLTLTLFVGLIMIIDAFVEKEADLASSGPWGQQTKNALQELNHFIFSMMAVTVNLATMVVPPLLMLKNLRQTLPSPGEVPGIIRQKLRAYIHVAYVLYLRVRVHFGADKGKLDLALNDADGSGMIDFEEFVNMECHAGMTRKKLRRLFKKLDVDESGELEYAEFVKHRAEMEAAVAVSDPKSAAEASIAMKGQQRLVRPGTVAKPASFAKAFMIRPPKPVAVEQDAAAVAAQDSTAARSEPLLRDDASSDKSAAKTPDAQDDPPKPTDGQPRGPPSSDFRQQMLQGTLHARKTLEAELEDDHAELFSPEAQSRLRSLVDSSKTYTVDSEHLLLLQPPPRQVSAAPAATKIRAAGPRSSKSSGSGSDAVTSEPNSDPKEGVRPPTSLMKRHASAFALGREVFQNRKKQLSSLANAQEDFEPPARSVNLGLPRNGAPRWSVGGGDDDEVEHDFSPPPRALASSSGIVVLAGRGDLPHAVQTTGPDDIANDNDLDDEDDFEPPPRSVAPVMTAGKQSGAVSSGHEVVTTLARRPSGSNATVRAIGERNTQAGSVEVGGGDDDEVEHDFSPPPRALASSSGIVLVPGRDDLPLAVQTTAPDDIADDNDLDDGDNFEPPPRSVAAFNRQLTSASAGDAAIATTPANSDTPDVEVVQGQSFGRQDDGAGIVWPPSHMRVRHRGTSGPAASQR